MCNILVIDDDNKFRPLLVRILTESGYHAFPTGTLEEAELMLEQHNFSLIVLDTDLPNGRGIDFARNLPKKTLKILLCEDVSYYDAKELNEIAVSVVIDKPFSEEDFINVVDRLMIEADIPIKPKRIIRDKRDIPKLEPVPGRSLIEEPNIRDIYVKTAVIASRVSDILERQSRMEKEQRVAYSDRYEMRAMIDSIASLSKVCPARGEDIAKLKTRVDQQEKHWSRATAVIFTAINLILTAVVAGIFARILGVFPDIISLP